VAAGRLQLAVQPPELVVHAVQVGGERAQLVAVRDVDAPGEVPGRDLPEAGVHRGDGPDERPRDGEPQHQGQAGGSNSKPDDRPPRPHERGVAGVHAGHHVGFRLVHELVCEPLQPVSERGRPGELQLPPFRDPTAPDQLHDTRDDSDELVVVGPHPAEQLDLVARDELQPIQVVAELVELSEDGVEAPVLGDEQGGGHTVELGRRVVLHLAVGGDLALQFHEVFRPAIHLAEDLETDRTERDQQADDDEERDEELGVHRGRDPGHETRERPHERAHHRPPSRRRERRSRSISSGSNRTPMYWTRSTPSRSTSEVRKVWSTSPRDVFRAKTPYLRVTSRISDVVPVRKAQPG